MNFNYRIITVSVNGQWTRVNNKVRSFRLEKYQEVPQVNTTFTQTACLNPILTVPGCGTCCTNGGTTLNLGANQVATFVPNIPVASVLTLQFKIQWPASADMSLRTVTYTTANGQTPIPVANFTKGDEYAFVTISKDIAPINLAVQFGVAGAVLKDISYSTTSGTYLVNDKMKDLLPEIICNQEDKTGKYFYTSSTGTCSLTNVNGNLVITPTSGSQESLARWYNGLEVGKSYTFVARVPIGTHFGNARPIIRVTDFDGRGITLQANTGLMPFNNGNHTLAQASRHPDGNEWVYWLRFPATTTSVKLEYLGAIQGVNEGQTLTSLQLLQTLPEVEYGGGSDYRYGFNTQQKQDDIYGAGNHNTALYWEYDTRLGRRWNIDPVEFPHISRYATFENNPFIMIDFLGDNASTHTDEKGNIIAVIDDGDLGVYKHNGNRDEATSELNKNYSAKNTSGGGTKMGETKFWDEFVDPIKRTPLTDHRIQFGKSFDNLIENMHEISKSMNLKEIASNSAPDKVFDVKKKYVGVGAMLKGKYATSRSAGNFLAGYNAQSGTYFGVGISFTTFQKLAGALHIESSHRRPLTKQQQEDIVVWGKYGSFNAELFKKPYYGELEYQYRMSLSGWNYGEEKK